MPCCTTRSHAACRCAGAPAPGLLAATSRNIQAAVGSVRQPLSRQSPLQHPAAASYAVATAAAALHETRDCGPASHSATRHLLHPPSPGLVPGVLNALCLRLQLLPLRAGGLLKVVGQLVARCGGVVRCRQAARRGGCSAQRADLRKQAGSGSAPRSVAQRPGRRRGGGQRSPLAAVLPSRTGGP